MRKRFNPLYVMLLMIFILTVAVLPAYAADDKNDSEKTGQIADDDLSKAVEGQSKQTLKDEVSKIGGSIVNAVRGLFITFFAIAVIFMGLQAAGGGLKDPRKVELIKGGGISAVISAVLVYKAEAIVAFVLDLLRVNISDILK
ncbi:MAG: hypothetical protein K6T65_08325 [Peptococcaceae bacterium]|nr:hypothetical protein [Peptococcaceae bacterium]